MKHRKFNPGKLVITPTASRSVPQMEIIRSIIRHTQGDWGVVGPEGRRENELALEAGFRLLSAYDSRAGQRFWILTEEDRSATTILLPEEY